MHEPNTDGPSSWDKPEPVGKQNEQEDGPHDRQKLPCTRVISCYFFHFRQHEFHDAFGNILKTLRYSDPTTTQHNHHEHKKRDSNPPINEGIGHGEWTKMEKGFSGSRRKSHKGYFDWFSF